MWKLALAFFVLSSSAALAQTPTGPVGANDPTRALPAQGSAPGGLDVARPAEAPAPAPTGGETRFTLNEVRFEGSETLAADELRPAWSDQVGTQVSLGDLRAIAARAEEIYADRGFPFVAVVLAAPQRVEGGVVRFTVIEGRITDLTILGSDPAARRQAAAVLAPLVEKQPLTAADVETAYEVSKSVPGLAVAGALRRGSQPGGMDLVVQASRESWRFYANLNNLYSDPVGPWGLLVGGDYFGRSRYGDQTSVQAYSTLDWDEQWVLRASHARRLTARGLTLSGTALVAKANPAGDIAQLDLATDVITGRLELSQPVVQRREGFLVASLALDVTDQKTDVFSNIALSEDRLRILSLGLAGEWRYENLHRVAASVEVRQGLDFADASQAGDLNLSRAGADPQALLLRARLEGEATLHPKLRFDLRFEGQSSDHSLTAPEQYSAGNLSIGRGYDPGSGFGDSAAGIAAELRFGPWALRPRLNVQPFVFYDAVKLWNENPLAVQGRTLDSWGGGLRFEVPGRFRFDVTYAEPLRAPLGLADEPVPSPTVLVNLTVGLDAAWQDVRRTLSRVRTTR